MATDKNRNPFHQVTVATDSHPEPVTFTYESLAEARRQHRRWVADGIRFAKNGSKWTDVRWLGKKFAVRGHDDGKIMVIERSRNGTRIWTREECREAVANY